MDVKNLDLASKIQRLRVAYNISQDQLAEIVGVPKSAVANWESGKSIPDSIAMNILCNYFDVTMEYLVNDSNMNSQKSNDIATIRKQYVNSKSKRSLNYKKIVVSASLLIILPIAMIAGYQVVKETDLFELADNVMKKFSITVETTAGINNETTTTHSADKEISQTTIAHIEISSKDIEFTWSDELCTWNYNTSIPTNVYKAYKSIDRNEIYGYSIYVTDKSDDEWIGEIVKKFKTEGQKYGYTDDDIVKLMISFVQSLDYATDIDTTGYDEYPKFPLETLYDKGGDCEDTCILLASLIREFGYGTVLIIFDDHMGIGIKGETGGIGSYFEYNGTPYYYVETTGENWEIGEIPDEKKKKKASIVPLF